MYVISINLEVINVIMQYFVYIIYITTKLK